MGLSAPDPLPLQGVASALGLGRKPMSPMRGKIPGGAGAAELLRHVQDLTSLPPSPHGRAKTSRLSEASKDLLSLLR